MSALSGQRPPFILEGTVDKVSQIEQAEQLLAKLGHWIPPDVLVDQQVLTGLPAEQIVIAARDWDADLVVVVITTGSVADAVVRHASCSVLVVRAKDRQSARAQVDSAHCRTSTIAAIRESSDAKSRVASDITKTTCAY